MSSITSTRLRISSGFTLMEVVIALGVFAIGVPAILGMFGLFASSTESVLDRGDAAAAVNLVELYLEGDLEDADVTVNPARIQFPTVYNWVSTVATNPAAAQVLYLFRTASDQPQFSVSQNPPASAITSGKVLVVEILAQGTSRWVTPAVVDGIQAGALPPNVGLYSKSYLPVDLAIHAVAVASQSRTRSTFVDTYPVVISR